MPVRQSSSNFGVIVQITTSGAESSSLSAWISSVTKRFSRPMRTGKSSVCSTRLTSTDRRVRCQTFWVTKSTWKGSPEFMPGNEGWRTASTFSVCSMGFVRVSNNPIARSIASAGPTMPMRSCCRRVASLLLYGPNAVRPVFGSTHRCFCAKLSSGSGM